MKKSSFFSRLTGSEGDDYLDETARSITLEGEGGERHAHIAGRHGDEGWASEEPQGELAVDVYQTPDAIVIKALVAGVQPTSIDIALTREMLTITGTREDEREVDEANYFQRELYWGSFSRTILLPEEVDVDMAEASEKHGILMIRLPKINKKRQTKLKVRSR
ncbi:Hsp20/alpha crystallin family protein, partial [Candidatus Kaiserbacteria bacterium]|nr:Hsp20/alpha crystallin family protein [Candidatus Kaiserbacteria bacterium]